MLQSVAHSLAHADVKLSGHKTEVDDIKAGRELIGKKGSILVGGVNVVRMYFVPIQIVKEQVRVCVCVHVHTHVYAYTNRFCILIQ